MQAGLSCHNDPRLINELLLPAPKIRQNVRHIYLLRHAHAVAGDATTPDHDRPLSSRGHAECAVIAQWVASHPLTPDMILCSSAIRTRETLASVQALGVDWPPAIFTPKLYLAPPGELLHQLQALPDEITNILLVGHNPGIQELALLLSGMAHGRDHELLELGMITGGLVGLETGPSAWSDLSPGTARFSFYCRVAETARRD